MFRNAKDIPLGPRGVHLSRACAVFTSLRARLGTWRDKEVAGIAEYTLQRECALRAARDRWLYSQLAKFAGAPHRIYGYVVKDSEKRDLLVKVRGMLDGDATRQEVMRCLWANRELFSREKTKPEFLAGHYGWVHRYVKAEELDKAKAKLDYLILFTDANKPRFVLDELSKDTDPYLKPVVELMLTAVQAFEAKDFKTAKEYFTQAANSMRRIAYR
jgi:hypothetical protein